MKSKKNQPVRALAMAMFALTVLTGAAVLADAVLADEETVPRPVHPAVTVAPPLQRQRPTLPERAPPTLPAAEPTAPTAATRSAGGFTLSPLTASDALQPLVGTTLTPPVTLAYSGTSAALAITDSGTYRGISTTLSNTANTASAIYGQASGSGAGVAGNNTGTSGPGGNFQVSNSKSNQAALFATTNGTGSAVLATATNQSPAVYGKNLTSTVDVYENPPIGVEGDGYYGVYGYSSSGGYGVVGGGSGFTTGVRGASDSGFGVEAFSTSSYGLYAQSNSNTAIYGFSDSSYGLHVGSNNGVAIYAESFGSGDGIQVHSASGTGIYAISDTQQGVFGQSKNSYGVVGEDSGSGVGVYGSSVSGYAGYFAGKVGARSYVTVSDRNAKTNVHPIDGHELLARVSGLPITAWDYKADLNKHHVGPMAQDFHAAFGLDGDDDRHINLVDLAGVSLAAIQELDRQVKQQDAQIAELKSQIATLAARLSSRTAALENQR